ncbi:MAG: family glycosyltransferase [Phycisphaerales bacterium]|nr:family glycosyltransferase [Phycisphaerales bacterium]
MASTELVIQGELAAHARQAPASRRRWALGGCPLAFWLAAAGLLLTPIAVPAVRRTQEARVLETAREMLGRGFDGWMIPHLNGTVRLQKPPLAYWFSACAFKLVGVSERTGRIPGALAGVLTLITTFVAAKWLFAWRTAWFAAIGLLGSYLFAKHVQLAETDGLATLFVTVGVVATWRGVGRRSHRGTASFRTPTHFWYCAGAIAIALAFLSKGPPALFPLLFLLAMAWDRGRPRILLDWFSSGAPVVFMAITLPWYGYVVHTRGFTIFGKELQVVLGGEDHGGSIFIYVPALLTALMPWTLLVILGIAQCVIRWRRDAKIRGLLLWTLAVLLPLCVAGNKQSHYLLPAMPPLILLGARMADLALRRSAATRLRRGLRFSVQVTTVGGLFAAAAVLLAPRITLGYIRFMDAAIAIGLFIIFVAAYFILRRSTQRGLYVLAGASAIALPLLTGLWIPSLHATDSRRVVSELYARFGRGAYCFVGDDAYLPVCFAMRTTLPSFKSAAELRGSATLRRELLILNHVGGSRAAPFGNAAQADFIKLGTVGAGDERFDVYQFEPGQRRAPGGFSD